MRAIALAAGLFLLVLSAGCGSARPASVTAITSATASTTTTTTASATTTTTAATSAQDDYIWQAASRLSTGCAHTVGSNGFSDVVFARGGDRPLVYYARTETNRILSSNGDRFRIVGNALSIWPCRTPVAVYEPPQRAGQAPEWAMMRLASSPAHQKTTRIRLPHPLGGAWEPLPNGRFLTFGNSIQYAGGKPITVSGIPRGWTIDSLNPSPRNSSEFVATVVRGYCSAETNQFAAAYLIRRGVGTKLRAWGDVCPDGVDTPPDWTPDGRAIVWSSNANVGDANSSAFYLTDSHGRNKRKLLTKACDYLLWSPNGEELAYEDECTPDKQRVFVLDLRSGATHYVAHGELEAWSPDGSELAVLQGYYCSEAGAIAIVPVAGGTGHRVITWPANGC